MIIFFEGPDRTGKSNIASALSPIVRAPVYKNKIEHALYRDNITSQFKNVVEISSVIELKFAKLYNDIIFDRNFISEWVYGHATGREVNIDLIARLDYEYSSLGACIIYCYKLDYGTDFDDEFFDVEQMVRVSELYQEYLLSHTGMRVLQLNTENKNITTQIDTICNFLWRKNEN